MNEQTNNINKRLSEINESLKLDRKRVMRRAWFLVRDEYITLSDALKRVWSERRLFVAKMNNEAEQLKNKLNRAYNRFSITDANESMLEAHNLGFEIN